MTDELSELENLLKSPGWVQFTAVQTRFWEQSLSQMMATAANDRDDNIALQKIRQVIAAQKAVQQSLAWPQERINQLKAQQQRHQPSESLSRGGFR